MALSVGAGLTAMALLIVLAFVVRRPAAARVDLNGSVQ